jgi:hypothetical protein
MTKLSEALDAVMTEARTTLQEKTASAEEGPAVTTLPESAHGAELRKLAAQLRTVDTSPSYVDLHEFVGQLP